MNILDSVWLVNMLKKSGKSPKARLLAIFDVLADWVEAPSIRESLCAENFLSTPTHLIDYLTQEARNAGAHMPEALAQQIYFVALGTLQEYLHNSESSCFSHAKHAAKALINAQTEKEFLRSKPFQYGAYASALIAISIGLFGYQYYQHPYFYAQAPANLSGLSTPAALIQNAPNFTVSPQNTAEMYAKMEQMRQGDCQYVEALLIPEEHKKVYLENVVAGQVPDNPKDQEIALQYLKRVRCNYTPMLMKNSTN